MPDTDGRFTDAELETARATDLPDLLASLGYQVKRVGSYYTTKEMDSLRIKNRRTWFRYSENRGGDAISFLERFEGKSFPEAVEYLLDFVGAKSAHSVSACGENCARSLAPPLPIESAPLGFDGDPAGARFLRAPPPVPEKKAVPFALPPPNSDNRRVTAYLQKRCIAPQVIRDFISAGLLYEDEQYHNCVFVGRNGAGKPVFAAKRGTYDLNGAAFRGGVPGSDKDVAFRLPCDSRQLRVFVFEAPIDLMSYCTLHRSVKSNAVALCCLYDGPLDTYLQENPHLRRIDLCLDADGPGRESAERMKAKYIQQGYSVTIHTPARGKDWNEYLQHRQKSRDNER